MTASSTAGTSSRLRAILLGVVAVGAIGLLLELSLLDHRDSATQWIPFFVLVAVIIATVIVWRATSAKTVRFFQIVMGLALVTGFLGVVLHFRGNVEFEMEHDPSLHGRRLIWEALHGATPALAPGALVQLALVGFAFAYRHPARSTLISDKGEDR